MTDTFVTWSSWSPRSDRVKVTRPVTLHQNGCRCASCMPGGFEFPSQSLIMHLADDDEPPTGWHRVSARPLFR